MARRRIAVVLGFGLILVGPPARGGDGPARAGGAWIWVEGEKPERSTMHRHPYWYDRVRRQELSGGDFITNFDDKPGEVTYRVEAPKGGAFEFWARINPVQASLAYRLGDGPWTPIDADRGQVGATNIAADGKPDLRFIAWVKVGSLELKRGENRVGFRFEGPNKNHGALDCFVLAEGPFRPLGVLKPDELADAERKAAAADGDWFAFDPKPDPFRLTSGIDLRSLNEPTAGDGGFIGVKGGRFVHTTTGEPVRFWAVNGPSGKDRETLRREARILAKRGVNLVRIHHGYFDKAGEVDLGKVKQAIEVVEILKAEGIYSHFSIYFPLWMTPTPETPWLPGYDGTKHPFAALYFNKDFQAKYRAWWTALLTTPSPATGRRLIDEPAVAGLEMVNEDSYFFWTFNAQNLPDAQLKILETQFGAWVRAKYNVLEAGLHAWDHQDLPRDNRAEGRLGFRPLWNMAHEKTRRDQDTARFLAESQRGFYKETYDFLRGLGFRGVITASNWVTASPEVLGPIEKSTYTVGDFLDRHGYFAGRHKGEAAEWSIREGHTYADRSALRFDPDEPGKPKQFVHPAMDVHYDGKPSMISETTWNRPNRYRSEAPLYLAAYGALQRTDAIVHFALDGPEWSVKPGFWTQPWTLMTPAMMGQFPAAALIYRKGLVAPGDVLVALDLGLDDLFALKGTPMPQDAAFDELRAKDVPAGTTLGAGHRIDPLVHYAGRTSVTFSRSGGPARLKDVSKLIDRKRQVVSSSTGQLRLDYGKGVLTMDAPSAQGVSGDLGAAGRVELKDLAITSGLGIGHVVAVSLDDRPLASSRKMLLQVMSEEQPRGFRTEPAGSGEKRIVKLGQDPWLVRKLDGVVKFKRADAARLKVQALDPNGDPIRAAGTADEVRLAPDVVYYLITP